MYQLGSKCLLVQLFLYVNNVGSCLNIQNLFALCTLRHFLA